MEEKEFARLLHEIAGHFDAFVKEVECVAERFAKLGVTEAEVADRLQRAKIVAEEGATLARKRLRDQGR